MIAEGYPAFIRDRITCIWFSSNELFVDPDETVLFKRFKMARKVAISHIQGPFKAVEIIRFVYHQDRHYAQTYPVFINFVQTGDRNFHHWYLLYMETP